MFTQNKTSALSITGSVFVPSHGALFWSFDHVLTVLYKLYHISLHELFTVTETSADNTPDVIYFHIISILRELINILDIFTSSHLDHNFESQKTGPK